MSYLGKFKSYRHNKGDNEKLCAMKLVKDMSLIPPPAGFENQAHPDPKSGALISNASGEGYLNIWGTIPTKPKDGQVTVLWGIDNCQGRQLHQYCFASRLQRILLEQMLSF